MTSYNQQIGSLKFKHPTISQIFSYASFHLPSHKSSLMPLSTYLLTNLLMSVTAHGIEVDGFVVVLRNLAEVRLEIGTRLTIRLRVELDHGLGIVVVLGGGEVSFLG